jgi:hypothetical protein
MSEEDLTPCGECEGCGATLFVEWGEEDEELCTGCQNADDNDECRDCRRPLENCKCYIPESNL